MESGRASPDFAALHPGYASGGSAPFASSCIATARRASRLPSRRARLRTCPSEPPRAYGRRRSARRSAPPAQDGNKKLDETLVLGGEGGALGTPVKHDERRRDPGGHLPVAGYPFNEGPQRAARNVPAHARRNHRGADPAPQKGGLNHGPQALYGTRRLVAGVGFARPATTDTCIQTRRFSC